MTASDRMARTYRRHWQRRLPAVALAVDHLADDMSRLGMYSPDHARLAILNALRGPWRERLR